MFRFDVALVNGLRKKHKAYLKKRFRPTDWRALRLGSPCLSRRGQQQSKNLWKIAFQARLYPDRRGRKFNADSSFRLAERRNQAGFIPLFFYYAGFHLVLSGRAGLLRGDMTMNRAGVWWAKNPAVLGEMRGG